MNPIEHRKLLLTRRHFFSAASTGIGTAALASLLSAETTADGGLPGLPHFAPKAKRVIYLFQHGAPSQLDLFDYKPKLKTRRGTELPDSIRQGQRLTGMTAFQASFPTAPSVFQFQQHGQSGMWLSELLPHTGKVADQIALIRTMQTEAINHDPAVTFFQTGFQLAGRPSIGAWISYGLGSANKDLPAFVVMVSQGTGNAQALADRAYGQRLSSDQIWRSQVPLWCGSRSLSVESARLLHGRSSTLSRRLGQAERNRGKAVSRPRHLSQNLSV